MKYPPARKPKAPVVGMYYGKAEACLYIGLGEKNYFEGATDSHVIDINVELEIDVAKGDGRPVDY